MASTVFILSSNLIVYLIFYMLITFLSIILKGIPTYFIQKRTELAEFCLGRNPHT
jgi:hypothetical protein